MARADDGSPDEDGSHEPGVAGSAGTTAGFHPPRRYDRKIVDTGVQHSPADTVAAPTPAGAALSARKGDRPEPRGWGSAARAGPAGPPASESEGRAGGDRPRQETLMTLRSSSTDGGRGDQKRAFQQETGKNKATVAPAMAP